MYEVSGLQLFLIGFTPACIVGFILAEIIRRTKRQKGEDMKYKIRRRCVVCGCHKQVEYKGDTGFVCVGCAAVENGTAKPEIGGG